MFLIKVLGICLAFHFYKNRYPKEFDDYSNQIYEYLKSKEQLKSVLPYLLKAGYVLVYSYSFCQIFLNKIIKISSPYVQSIRDNVCKILVKYNIISDKLLNNMNNLNKTNLNTITNNDGVNSIAVEDIKTIISFFNEGDLIKKQELSTMFNDLAELEVFQDKNDNENDYDLITITIISKNEDNINSNILTVVNIITVVNKQTPTHPYSFELSNIKFIACYVKQDDISYTLDLCKDNTNYYIVGNVINCAFIKYYLKNVLNVTIDNNIPFKYTLEIMDHNVNMIYLTEKDDIVIHKDDYIVNNSKKSVNNSETLVNNSETLVVEEFVVIESNINESNKNETNNSKTKVE